MYDYDACFIYHPNERQVADALIERLTQDARLRIVPYMWPIAPLRGDAEKVSQLLEQSASWVMLSGGSAFPPLEDVELREKLAKPETSKSPRIMITVLLPGSDERLQPGDYVIDLREDSAEAMSQLVAAIVRHTPSPVRYVRDPDVTSLPAPPPPMSPSVSGVFLPVPGFTERPEMDILRAFWRDSSHGGVLALVGIGGSGKTALLTRLLQELPDTPLTNPALAARSRLPSPRGLFAWSIYDEPNIEYFVRGLYTYLTGIPTVAPAREVVYRLIRHIETTPLSGVLIALDGLEMVQEDRDSPGGFGLLRDSSLRHFVRAIASLGNVLKLIVTSRYPLPELTPFAGDTYHEIDANQVTDATARAFLRGQDVYGSDADFDAVLSAYGNHVLTLGLLGRLITAFYKGDLKAALALPDAPDQAPDADTQAARLARVLAAYNASLPPDALAVLRVLSAIHIPVTFAFLLDLFVVGNQPPFVTSVPMTEVYLRAQLGYLRDYGLIAFYGADAESACVTHPAIAAYFVNTLGDANRTLRLILHMKLNDKARYIFDSLTERIHTAIDNPALALYEYVFEQGLQIAWISPVKMLFKMRIDYKLFAWQQGDYQRGERITSMFARALKSDPIARMSYEGAPAYEQNLYRLDLGKPAIAETHARQQLQEFRAFTAQTIEVVQDATDEAMQQEIARDQQEMFAENFGNYEGALIQALFDTLFVQGKLVEAYTMIDEALNAGHNWRLGWERGMAGAGSNPYARRALALSFLGDVPRAFEDYAMAAQFAVQHRKIRAYTSFDWHFKPFEAEFLARLGHLDAADRLLRRMDYAHINATRPLTTACYNLAVAQIAYLRSDDASALPHIEAALGWAMQSGHQHTYLQALIVRARLHVRVAEYEDALTLLAECIETARTDGYALQQIDALTLLTHVALRDSDALSAQQSAEAALSLSQMCAYRWGEGDAAHALASVAFAQVDYAAAMQHAAHALTIRSQIQDPRVQYTQTLIDKLTPYL